MKSIDQTKAAFLKARAKVSRVAHYKGEPGSYYFQWRDATGDVQTSPTDSYAATRNARRRKIIETAAVILHCDISALHPAAMGETFKKLAHAMGRAEDASLPRWQWSPEARARASERARARWQRHREALAAEAMAAAAPRIRAARATMEAAAAAALPLVPASVPPEHRESFAAWIAGAGFV